MDLGLQGRVAMAGSFQHGVRVAPPMGKNSSVVFQLALDPAGCPHCSAHISSLRTGGHLPARYDPCPGQGNTCALGGPAQPRCLPVQKSFRSDNTGATHPPACPRDHTPHTQVGAAAQSVSSEGDGARVFQCKPLQCQAVPAACGTDPARAAGLHPDAVPCPDPGHARVRQFQVKGGCLLLKSLHIRQRCPNRHLPGCKGSMSVSRCLPHHRAPGFPVCACWSDHLNPVVCTGLPPLPTHPPV